MNNKQEDENSLLNSQQTIKVQDGLDDKANYSKKLIVLVISFLFTFLFNLYKPSLLESTPNLVYSPEDSSIKALNQIAYDFPKSIDIKEEINSFQIRLTQKFNESKLYKDRVSLSEPKIASNPLKIHTIRKKTQNNRKYCILTTLSKRNIYHSLEQGRQILSTNEFDQLILIQISIDITSDNQYLEFVKSSEQNGFQVQKEQFVFDSDYLFIRKYTSGCISLTLLQENSNLKQPNMLLSEIRQHQKSFVLYSNYVLDSNRNSVKLLQLQKENLQSIKLGQLQKYLFSFDPIYFQLITPLNFAYYAKYSLTEILILPIIAVSQSKLKAIIKPLHQIDGLQIPIVKYYPLHQVNKQVTEKKLKKGGLRTQNFCFVSYSSNPQVPSLQELKQYFSSLKQVQLIEKATIVINIPYNHETHFILYEIFAYLIPFSRDGINIRLRVRNRKVVSSLSIYQASYTYCPSSSTIISSRHNIAFQKKFLIDLSQELSYKNHYYYFDFENEIGEQIVQKQPFRYTTNKFRINAMYYEQYFSHVQIFKSQLFQMLYFWILKNDELDFYETQASFVLPMLEMVRAIVGVIPRKGYKVFSKRIRTSVETEQLENLKLYFQWSQIPSNSLKPFKVNALQNQAFMKNAREKIPKKLHQVWLGSAKISPFQSRLHNSLKQVNHDFQMNLWQNENITKENFPITFSLVERSLKYQNYFPGRSLIAPIVSLIRYEILYNLGGIYIDFKTQGRKNLSPFLKYQLFFIDLDYDENHYIWPSNVGNGVIGATKGNYHLKLTLSQIISQERFNYKLFDFPKMVGGFILRQSLTESQLFNSVGFGFQLFSQKPGKKPNLCSTQSQEQYENDQEKFKVENPKTGKIYTVGVPCRKYKQAYLIFYKIIAGSWKVI